MMTVGRICVQTIAEFESDFVESELTVIPLEDLPASIACRGSSQIAPERAQLQLGVQEAPEISVHDNATGHFELRVSKALDADPDSNAEEEDDPFSKRLMGESFQE